MLPESQWRGYRPPLEPPVAPWPETWGATHPLPSALAQTAWRPIWRARLGCWPATPWTRWRPPWHGSGAPWRPATREFSRTATHAEKPAPELNPTCNSRFGPADRRKEGALNNERLGEAVPQADGFMDEARARAINAEPWKPRPGMVKRQCPVCRYFFAVPCQQPGAALPGLRR